MVVATALGRFGEGLAAEHLAEQGLRVLARNWRCSVGEVDIVAADGDTLVICEVKTRRGVQFGHPLEAVTPTKHGRLLRLAVEYRRHTGYPPARLRVDVVGVLVPRGGRPTIEHVRGVAW
jgi:putative endonuclease